MEERVRYKPKEKPYAAIFFSLNGGAFIVIIPIIFSLRNGTIQDLFSKSLEFQIFIIGLIIMSGGYLIYSGNLILVKVGGIISIIFSIFSLILSPVVFLGFLLAMIGGILALKWKPRKYKIKERLNPS